MQALPSGRALGVLARVFAVSGFLISPFLAPQLQTRPARSRACGPQALRQAAAPHRREAPERAPDSALRTRARERLRERGVRQAVYAERRGRGPARAREPPALRFPVAAEIGVGDPKKACAREALARCTEKDLATRRQSSRSPPPPQSGGLCSPALDRPWPCPHPNRPGSHSASRPGEASLYRSREPRSLGLARLPRVALSRPGRAQEDVAIGLWLPRLSSKFTPFFPPQPASRRKPEPTPLGPTVPRDVLPRSSRLLKDPAAWERNSRRLPCDRK